MILAISSKKVYAAKRLREEAGIRKQELGIMDVANLVACDFKIDLKKFDVLYVRDPFFEGTPKYIPQIIKLAKQFKRAGKRVVDSVIANGELGQGKWADYQKLMKAGLPIPETYKQFTISARGGSASGGNNLQLTYPLVLKWVYGFKAKDVFLINNQEQLKSVLLLHPKKEWLAQEFIKAEYEYKVITVGYKALPVVLRFKILDAGFRTDFDKYDVIKTPTTPSALRPPLLTASTSLGVTLSIAEWVKGGGDAPRLSAKGRPARRSFSEGGSFSSFSRRSPTEGGEVVGVDKIKKITQLAELSSRVLNRELAKVDILQAQGKFYILEVNRFPGLKSFEELTKFNVIKMFLDYLQNPSI